MAFYLRTENDKIEFLTDEIHKIKDTDMLLLDEEYKNFFELQSQGKQYRLKGAITLNIPPSLFDYIEEFENEIIPTEEVVTLESLMSEIESLKAEIQTIKTNLSLE